MTLLKTYMMKLSTAATITGILSNVFCILNCCALITPAFKTRVSKLAPKVFLFLLLPQPATCKKYMKLNIFKLEDQKPNLTCMRGWTTYSLWPPLELLMKEEG